MGWFRYFGSIPHARPPNQVVVLGPRSGGERQRKQRFLFEFVGFGGAGGGTGAGRTLDRTEIHATFLRDLRQAGHDVEKRTHVAGLFLNPDDFAGIRMGRKGGGDFRARERIELVEKQDCGGGVLAFAALGFQFVADFAAGDQDVPGVGDLAIGNDLQEVRRSKVIEIGRGVRVTQHAFGRENDEWFAPWAASLAAQHVEILRGAARLADLNVVFSGKLQEAFDTGAGMFRALAFKSVRKEQDHAGWQVPFVFTGADELVDDDLRAVDEITELRFP